MALQKNKKWERLEARIRPEQKQLFKRAAELSGQTLSDFIVSTLQEAAQDKIEKQSMLKLSIKDQETFAHYVIDPPQPNERLQKAAQDYNNKT